MIVFVLFCKKSEHHSNSENTHDHHHHESMSMGKVSDQSIYNLQSKWIDTSEKQMELKNFKNKLVFIVMFYGTCKDVCPILVEDLKRIEKNLGDKSNSVQFLLVSFDSEKDTPQTLKSYRNKSNLEKNNWFLLTGNSNDVQELAAVLGVKYKKEENGMYSHSNIITLLNKEGEIIYSLEGLNKDSSELVSLAIKRY